MLSTTMFTDCLQVYYELVVDLQPGRELVLPPKEPLRPETEDQHNGEYPTNNFIYSYQPHVCGVP